MFITIVTEYLATNRIKNFKPSPFSWWMGSHLITLWTCRLKSKRMIQENSWINWIYKFFLSHEEGKPIPILFVWTRLPGSGKKCKFILSGWNIMGLERKLWTHQAWPSDTTVYINCRGGGGKNSHTRLILFSLRLQWQLVNAPTNRRSRWVLHIISRIHIIFH